MELYKQKWLSHIKIVKEIKTFDDIEVEKHKLYGYKKLFFLEDVNIKNALYLIRFILVKRTINILLVTCMIIIKLSHCTYFFWKRARM